MMSDVKVMVRPLFRSFLLIFVSCFGSTSLFAQTANLGFGQDGWLKQPLAYGDAGSYGYTAAVQSDGKIVVGGMSEGADQEILIVRYNADGTLDTSFDGDGAVIVDSGGQDRARDVAIQADGKIVFVGFDLRNDFELIVGRLNSDGSPDDAFGDDGMIREFLGGDTRGENLVIQDDGKIVVLGRRESQSTLDDEFVLLRYNSNGTRDATFGTSGLFITPYASDVRPSGLALQADGKIIVSGEDRHDHSHLVIRHNTNGTLDATFDGDGIVVQSFSTGFGGAEDVAVAPNQQIIVLGYTEDMTGLVLNLWRYNADGSLDATFDEGTIVNGFVDFSATDKEFYGESLAIQGDGKPVIVGGSYDFSGFDFVSSLFAIRFDTTGSLDTGFDSDGLVEHELNIGEDNQSNAAVLQADGKIAAVGVSRQDVGDIQLNIVRYNTNGALDTSFSGDGYDLANFDGPQNSYFQALVLQPDGKILGGGTGGSQMGLVRFHPDGKLDTSFDGDGIVNLDPIDGKSDDVTSLAIQLDGKILAAGAGRSGGSEEAALVRLNADGSPDSSFGTGGVVETGSSDDDVWNDVLPLANGKIIVTGNTTGVGFNDLIVARYDSAGLLDPTFGTGGIFQSALLTAGFDLYVQADGKILVAGRDENANDHVGAIRLTQDGALDTTFGGGDGFVTTTMEGTTSRRFHPMAVQCDGSFVLIGDSYNGNHYDVGLARFTADGASDPTFGTNGFATVDFARDQKSRGVQLQADGKIIVGGYDRDSTFEQFFMLVRFNSDGSPDAGFGTGGKATFDDPRGDGHFGYALALADGHAYLAGESDNYGGLLDVLVTGESLGCDPGLEAIVALDDVNGNGMPELGVAVPGSTRVHIRDGSTDILITDIDFGEDTAFDMAVLPDLDGSGDPEIALLQQQPSGQVRVQARDTVSGAVTKNLWYGLQYEPVSMDVVADYSGNSLPEVAVLGSEAGTDAVRVQIQDTATGFLDNVFLGTQSIAKDLVSVTDTSGNGKPEMGILGVLKANDQVRMQLWDADTAAFQSNVWFAKVYQPQSTITMPDVNSNGSDEIVAVGVDPATQNIRVQVRDSDTTATLYNIWLGNTNEAVDVALINDINGNGFPDLAILLKTPTETGRVRVQDGLNGAFIRNLFYTVVENPVGLAVMPDYSGNGFEELAVLGENAGTRHVQILDTSSGSQVNRIDYP